MNRITIIGAGFAGLTAAQQLRRRLPQAQISLIAPEPTLIYLPSLIWLPFGQRSAEDLRVDLTDFFAAQRIDYLAGRVTGLSDDGREVLLEDGQRIANDGLIIASGGRFLKGLPGIEHGIALCEGIPAAERLRDRLAEMAGGHIALGFGTNPKEPSAMRGGPMFELMFGLDTHLRRQGRRDRFTLTFFNGSPRPGARLGERAVDGLLKEMARRDIHTHLGHKPQAFSDTAVTTEGGEIPADLILFMPGMTGPAWIEHSGLPRSPGGLIQADAQARVPGLERVYVAGDSGSFPGPDWSPKQAHMADLQATTAAHNLAGEFQGQAAERRFRTELVCIVDSLDRGILVARNERRTLMLPPLRLMHWAKAAFEWHYLRQYRRPRKAA